MIQLAIDVFMNMIVSKEFWIIIGSIIIWGLYMEWSKYK